jgi:pilus assembly protein CpaC
MPTSIMRLAALGGGHRPALRTAAAVLVCLAAFKTAQAAGDHRDKKGQVIHRLESANETLELTVNTSRILTVGKELPRVTVNNPAVAEVTPISPTHIQVMAKKPGVTQVNLFDQDDNIYSVDLLVYPDARELTMLLRTQFPTAALKVVPTATSVIISGYVDDPNQVQRIIDIASDYSPKVLNNIRVGGVQQVLLQVKVMEVSRTKLRNMGFDWGNLGKSGQGFATNGVGGLLSTMSQQSSSAGGAGGQALGTASTAFGRLMPSPSESMTFGVVSGANQFFGVLNLLTQKGVAKVMAEPQFVTVSGRPAQFMVGGQIPIPMSGGLGTQNVTWKNYGTQVDFVPIVLGNGGIRLEVRPQVSELDYANSVTLNGSTIPSIVTRQVDTAVELRSGETFALAGLVKMRVETSMNGLIWISELPLLGIPFRRMSDNYNEVETLIMCTPHLVDAMPGCEVPPGGPGFATALPDDTELYARGHVEVPNCQGQEMLGPYPDSHGMFAPVSKEAWEEPVPAAKPDGKATATPPGPSSKGTRGTRTDDGAQNGFVAPPKPPSLSGGKTAKMSPAGFARFNSQGPSNRAAPTVKPGASRQKKVPGFIGPTGYDLR